MNYFKVLLLSISFSIFIFSCSKSVNSNDNTNVHFEFVLYDGLSMSMISEISQELEENFIRIINDLKVSNMPAVTVRLWSNYDNFLKTMQSDIGIRYDGAKGYIKNSTEIILWYNEKSPIQAVHEFAHVVSMQVNSRISNNPRWLWEAVAVYEADQFIDPKNLPYMVSGDYPSLLELNGDFNSSNNKIYNIGYVLLEYIIQTWDMDTVIGLIKNNGNIENLLGVTTAEFEAGWYQFVEEKYLM